MMLFSILEVKNRKFGVKVVLALTLLNLSACNGIDTKKYELLTQEYETKVKYFDELEAKYDALENENCEHIYLVNEDLIKQKNNEDENNDLVGAWKSKDSMLVFFADGTGFIIESDLISRNGTYKNISYNYEEKKWDYAIFEKQTYTNNGGTMEISYYPYEEYFDNYMLSNDFELLNDILYTNSRVYRKVNLYENN